MFCLSPISVAAFVFSSKVSMPFLIICWIKPMDIRLLFTKSFRGRTFSFSVVACLFLRHVYPKFVEIWLQNLIDIIWNHSFKSPAIVWREAIFWGKSKLSALGFTSNPHYSYMYVFSRWIALILPEITKEQDETQKFLCVWIYFQSSA